MEIIMKKTSKNNYLPSELVQVTIKQRLAFLKNILDVIAEKERIHSTYFGEQIASISILCSPKSIYIESRLSKRANKVASSCVFVRHAEKKRKPKKQKWRTIHRNKR